MQPEEMGMDFEALAKGVRTERTDMEFRSVRATFGTGEHLAALIPLTKLTSFFVVAGGFTSARLFMRAGEEGAKTTRAVGFMPVREFPFGFSLRRTVLFDCSNSFARILWRGKSRETASTDAVSETDVRGLGLVIVGLRAGGGSCAAFRVLISSPRGAGREPGINELGLTEERVS